MTHAQSCDSLLVAVTRAVAGVTPATICQVGAQFQYRDSAFGAYLLRPIPVAIPVDSINISAFPFSPIVGKPYLS